MLQDLSPIARNVTAALPASNSAITFARRRPSLLRACPGMLAHRSSGRMDFRWQASGWLALSEHRFDVVAIRIENECSVVTWRIAAGAKSRPAIV